MSESELLAIDGVGKAKLEKYGDEYKRDYYISKNKNKKIKKKLQPTRKALLLYQRI
jgi:ATP-dependent DNA helicase RecQ